MENKVKTLEKLYGKAKSTDFLAWWIDLSICFIIAQCLSNFDGLYAIEEMLFVNLPFYLGGPCYLWIVSVALNFPILMMSGISYGEYVTGFRHKEKYQLGSFISLVRYSVRFFVGPYPKLANYLFGFKLPQSVARLGKSWSLSIVLFLLLLNLISPMMRSLRFGGSITKVTKNFSLDVAKDMETESRLSSQRLQFTLKLPTSFFSHWVLFPRFDLIKDDKRSLISSYLQIQNITNFDKVEFERSRKINLTKLLSSEFASHSHLTRNNENLQSDILNQQDKKWSMAGKEELKELFDNSLTFGSSILGQITHQLSQGPFTSGNLSLRAELKKIIPLTEIESFSFIKLGQHSFILFMGSFHNVKRYTFFSLEEKSPYVYSLTWQGDTSSRDLFMSNFFKKVSWEFSDDKDFWSYPNTPSDITVTHLMDMLIENELSQEHQNSLEVALYMYYFSLYKKALLENNDKMISIVKVEIKKIDRIINLKKSKMTPVFIARWNSLVTNTMNSNKKYFEVGK